MLRPPVGLLAFALIVLGTSAATARRVDPPPPRFTPLSRIGAAPGRFVLAGDLIFAAEGSSLSVLSVPATGRAEVLAAFDPGRGDVQDLAYDGGILYLLTMSGVTTVDAHDPTSLQPLGFTPGGGQALAAGNGWVFVAARQAGVRIIDAHEPSRPQPAATLAAAGDASLIQLSATSHTGSPLLVVGEGTAGVRVLDAAVPVALRELAVVPLRDPESLSLAPEGDQLWVAAGGRVEAFDLADPAHPRALGRYAPPTQARRVWYQNDYAYIADERDGLKVLDMHTPVQPLLVWAETDRPAHDLVPAGTALAVATPEGVRFYDLSDPAHPRETGALALGSAWGLTVARNTHVAGRPVIPLLVAADAGLIVVNAQDPAQPYEIARLDLPGHARDVTLSATETRAYLALAQPGGVAVVDTRDWLGVHLDGQLDLSGDGESLVARSGTVYLSAGTSGFYVIDVINPAAPRLVASLPAEPGQSFGDVTLGETRAYVAAGPEVALIDIGVRTRPTLVGRIPAPAAGVHLHSARGYLAVAGAGELHWVYVRPRTGPIDTGIYHRPAAPFVLALSADQLLVGSGAAAQPGQPVPDLTYVDMQDAAQPREVARFGDGPGGAVSVHFAGTQALFTAGHRGLLRYDLTAPAVETPDVPAAFVAYAAMPVHTPPVGLQRLTSYGDRVIVAGNRGWAALSLAEPARPQVIAGGADLRSTVDVALSETMAYAASGSGQVMAFDLANAEVPQATWDSHSQLTALAVGENAAVAGDTLGVLHVLSVQPALQLVKLAELSLPGSARRIVVDNGYAYVAAGAAGLRIVDVRAPTAGVVPSGRGVASPTLAIAGAYGLVATLDGRDLRLWAGDGQAPLARALRARTLALDAHGGSVPRVYADAGRAIVLVEALTATLRLSASFAWPVPVHTLQAAPLGGQSLLLVGDEDGLTLLDWADPARQPRQVSVLTRTGSVDAAAISGPMLWAAGPRLAAIDAAVPEQPRVAAVVDLPSPATALTVSGTQVLTGAADGVRMFSWDGGAGLVPGAALTTPAPVRSLAWRGERVFAALEAAGVWILAVDAQGGLQRLAAYPARAGSAAVGLSQDGGDLLVAWQDAWQALDIAHPAAPPAEAGALALEPGPAEALDVAVRDGVAVVAAGDAGLWVADVHDPAAPTLWSHIPTPGEARGAALGDDVAFVADGPCGVHAYDVHDPTAPADLGSISGEGAQDIAWQAGLLYSVDTGDLRTLRFDPAGALAAPSSPGEPTPADGADVISGALALTWSVPGAACGGLQYDVSIAGPVALPVPEVHALAEPRWALGALPVGTYHWQVVVHDALGGETRGPQWHFTQRAQPAGAATVGPIAEPPRGDRDDGATLGAAILAGLGGFVLLGSLAMLWRMRRSMHR